MITKTITLERNDYDYYRKKVMITVTFQNQR